MRATALIVVFAMLSAASGCATYVNIPPQGGDLARHDPNLENARDVQKFALQAILNDRPIDGPYHLALPDGARPETYETLASQLEPTAVWSSEESNAASAELRVSQVRIRGWLSQVDVVHPVSSDSIGQLISAYLRWTPFGGWYVQRLRAWQTPVDEAIQQSRLESATTLP